MESAPTVSIAMPAYNASATIVAAIESLLAQSFQDFELIVCDDASTDGTTFLVEAFNDPRIKLLKNASNMGEGVTRDKAIQAATGRWIAVIDADDAWLPHRLQTLLNAVGDAEQVVVFDDIMICHHTTTGLVPWRALRGCRAFGSDGKHPIDVRLEDYIRADRLLIKPMFPAAAVLHGRLRHTRRRLGADNEYFIKLGITGLTFRYFPEAMYMYRMMPGSVTAQADGVLSMSTCIQDCLKLPGLSQSVKLALEDKLRSLQHKETLHRASRALLAGHALEAAKILARDFQAIRISPGRLLRHLAYQFHRLRHSGRAR